MSALILLRNSIVLIVLFSFLLFGGTSSGDRVRLFTVVVRDSTGPVEGAIVRVAATEATGITGADGTFRIPSAGEREAVLVTAWKEGYYNGGIELDHSGSGLVIELRPLTAPRCARVDQSNEMRPMCPERAPFLSSLTESPSLM